jgi:hypothetical protein
MRFRAELCAITAAPGYAAKRSSRFSLFSFVAGMLGYLSA